MKRRILLAFCLLISTVNLAQDRQVLDSLNAILTSNKHDSEKVRTYISLANQFRSGQIEQATSYLQRGITLAKKSNLIFFAGTANKTLGSIYNGIGEYEKAMACFEDIVLSYKKVPQSAHTRRDKLLLADAYNNTGISNHYKGDFRKALEYHLLALSIREAVKDKKAIATSYNNIGLVYDDQQNYPMALEFHFKSLEIKLAKQADGSPLASDFLIATSYGNIGNVYHSMQQNDKAKEYILKALKLFEKDGSGDGISACLANLGSVYYDKKDFKNSTEYYLKSLALSEKLGDQNSIANALASIGGNYSEMGDHAKAIEMLNRGLKISREIGAKDREKECLYWLSESHARVKEFAPAWNYLKDYSLLKDTLINEENNEQIAEMAAKYDTEKKSNEILLLKKEKEFEQEARLADIKRQQVVRNSLIGGVILVFLVALSFYFRYREKRNANIKISKQKTELEQAHHQLEERNKNITDSINYARRIQHARLPELKYMQTFFPQVFVYYMPKDIVSGDFYYFEKRNDILFLAAADCTGHGVPGALMSMMGSEKLEDSISKSNNPSEILKLLNVGIKSSLSQSGSEESTKDGMDIALCAVDANHRWLKFSGANRPLWIIRNEGSTIEEIKGNNKSIGGTTENEYAFTSHEISIANGDSCYIFSDGFVDQFGGPEGKKLMSKRLKELLLSIQHLTMYDQHEYLKSFMKEWKSNTKQMDDMLVIGMKW